MGPREFPPITESEGMRQVTLLNFARFYGFPRPRAEDRTVTLEQKGITLILTLDSRKALVNGVSVWLHEPVTRRRRLWLISETDALRVLDPLLRPDSHLAQAGRQVVVIDAGHGGKDPGTSSPTGLKEKEVVLDISLRVRSLLKAAGVDARVTREEDQFIELADRARMAKEAKADLFVSIHFNASSNTDAKGFETFVLTAGGHPSTSDQDSQARSFPPDYPANEWDGRATVLAYEVQRHLLTRTGHEDRGVRRARFLVLREAVCPAILVECGFLSNLKEERMLYLETYRDKLAQGIAQGVLDYLSRAARVQVMIETKGNPP